MAGEKIFHKRPKIYGPMLDAEHVATKADLDALVFDGEGYVTDSELATELATKADTDHTHVVGDISDFNTAVDARAQSVAQSQIDATIGAAPELLDTLAEIAAAIGDDPNFAATITGQLAQKATKATLLIGDGAATTLNVAHGLNAVYADARFFEGDTEHYPDIINRTSSSFDAVFAYAVGVDAITVELQG